MNPATPSLLEQIGITQEELQKRVVERLCDRVMGTVQYDVDGEEYAVDSRFAKRLEKQVETAINARIAEIGKKYIAPQVSEIVEKLTLQQTNQYGEKRGEPMSFVEYMVHRAEDYLSEKVDFNGKTREQDSYNWKGTQTRITHIVNQHLHYSVSTAMTKAVNNANQVLACALAETCKIKLEEIAKSLKVTVEAKP